MEFQAVSSSHILGIAYDPNAQALYIEFKGGAKYRYDGVDEDEYNDFLSAGSKGSYFHDNIKDGYPSTRV